MKKSGCGGSWINFFHPRETLRCNALRDELSEKQITLQDFHRMRVQAEINELIEERERE